MTPVSTPTSNCCGTALVTAVPRADDRKSGDRRHITPVVETSNLYQKTEARPKKLELPFLGIASMALYLWKRHPRLRGSFDEAPWALKLSRRLTPPGVPRR